MASKPSVSFIICTYNRAEYLHDSLLSLLQTNVSPEKFEILIVDNNSTDETAAVVQIIAEAHSLFQFRVIKESQQGLSHARNRGITEARAPFVVFLDDDIRASKSLISAWIAFFNEHPEAMAAGGKIHIQFDDPRPDWISHFLLPLLGYHNLGNSQKSYPQNKYPFGGNMGFKKSVFDAVGLFDADLGRKGSSLSAGEEKELFRRIREKNHSIYYVPKAVLYHRVDADRLTIDYIREQALGLGQSMKLQLKDASAKQKCFNWFGESFKLVVSVPLAIGYLLTLKPGRAKLLFQFRWWILEGYFNFT